jgi:plastocyanin
MTSRLLICSSVLWVAALLPGGSLTGRVQIAAATAGRSFEGVAVWLMPVQGKAPAPAAQTHRVLQKNKRFSPHVSVISVGSTVDWPNLDPIFHNAFSNFAGQPFDTGLYPPGGTQRTRFQREGVVRVFCNIHSSMSAVIVVVPTPWFATTRPDGTFAISDVPPGDYTLKVWHERSPEGSLRAAERRITVGGDVAIDPVSIAETGFVSPPPHKNKYGLDYPPEPPAKAGYEQAPRSPRLK